MGSRTKPAGIAIGMCSVGRMCPPTMIPAMATQIYPANTNIAFIQVLGDTIANARNRCVEEAQKVESAKYLWFVDDDTVPPRNAANRLMYLLDNHGPSVGGKVMVAGGIYCMKSNPPTPHVFLGSNQGPHYKWKVGDVFKCWGLGTGCMMIDMEIFKHIESPYFRTVPETREEAMESPDYVATDDLYFCQKVHDVGFEIMADGAVLCQHWDVEKRLVYTMPSQSYPMLQREAVAEA